MGGAGEGRRPPGASPRCRGRGGSSSDGEGEELEGSVGDDDGAREGIMTIDVRAASGRRRDDATCACVSACVGVRARVRWCGGGGRWWRAHERGVS